MKRLLIVLAAMVSLVKLGAEGLDWTADLNAAQKQAKAEKRLVFLNFTGSDWCGWCKKLEADVFSKPAFQKYAKDNLVMVVVDFPRAKKLSDSQKEANAALKKKYGVSGYPTLVVLNAEGKEVHREVGYMGDVDKWVANLNAAKKK